MEVGAAERRRMVARLVRRDVVTSPVVEHALRDVPRHRFLPTVSVEEAYADQAVVVARLPDGTPISSASQPTIVALMLEALGVRPGHRVLEVGTGTGYNAALLSRLVGDGSVVTVELEQDLAERAAGVLTDVAADRVRVVVGDGGLGHPPGAPYDRMIVTAGAPDVSGAWAEQLVPGGRLVVPIVAASGVGSIVVYDEVDGVLVPGARTPCGFLPLRTAPAP